MIIVIMGCCSSSFSSEFKVLSALDLATVKERTFNGVARLARVTEVYDGDTITIICKLDKEENYRSYKLRLLGTDAPEMKPSKNMANRELHIEAAKKVKQLLTDKIGGKVVEVVFCKEEKFGRCLGTVWTVDKRFGTWIRREDINKWLVDRKLVHAYFGDEKSSFTVTELKTILMEH